MKCQILASMASVYIPMVAATSGTLSINAEATPKNMMTKSWLGIIWSRYLARSSKTPNDSNDATDTHIPRKNCMMDISILEGAWWAEYICLRSCVKFSSGWIYADASQTTPNESIMPTYGGRCVIVLKMGTKI